MNRKSIDIPSFNTYEFITEQLVYHDYIASPFVYDADEEYVATLLYSLSSIEYGSFM